LSFDSAQDGELVEPYLANKDGRYVLSVLRLTFPAMNRFTAMNNPLASVLALLIIFNTPSWSWAEEASPPVKVLVTYHSLSGNTEQMADAVAEGVRSVPGTLAVLKRVGQVTADDLFSSDAVIVGSPVYWSNMSGEVKTFFDNWQFKFGVFPDFKMKNKVGAAFATGGQISSGKEITMLTILAAMLGNQMIVVSGGGAFGASATTEGDSPGIDKKELAEAKALGRRVADVAKLISRAAAQ
jgi:NAD(P)H dehydrogenase (quinone)